MAVSIWPTDHSFPSFGLYHQLDPGRDMSSLSPQCRESKLVSLAQLWTGAVGAQGWVKVLNPLGGREKSIRKTLKCLVRRPCGYSPSLNRGKVTRLSLRCL